jgi:hypothetical protein
MKLAALHDLLQGRSEDERAQVHLKDFLEVIETIVKEDDAKISKEVPTVQLDAASCRVRNLLWHISTNFTGFL